MKHIGTYQFVCPMTGERYSKFAIIKNKSRYWWRGEGLRRGPFTTPGEAYRNANGACDGRKIRFK